MVRIFAFHNNDCHLYVAYGHHKFVSSYYPSTGLSRKYTRNWLVNNKKKLVSYFFLKIIINLTVLQVLNDIHVIFADFEILRVVTMDPSQLFGAWLDDTTFLGGSLEISLDRFATTVQIEAHEVCLILHDYKNLSPVSGADGIFRSQGGLFMQYQGCAELLQKQSPKSWKFPSVTVVFSCISFLKIKMEQIHLICFQMFIFIFCN